MNKTIIIKNIQSLITSLELTIEKLAAIMGENKIYSEEQINKQITLLQIKLADDDNYKKVSSKVSDYEALLERTRREKDDLKSLINNVEAKNEILNQQKDLNNSILSFEQKELESLANRLDGSSNDEEISQSIKQKREKIESIKKKINALLEKIKANDADIDFYKKKLDALNLEEENYLSLIEQTPEFIIDELKKENDIKELNRFLNIEDLFAELKILSSVKEQLSSLYEYLENNRVNMNLVNSKVEEFKERFRKINVVVEFFAKSINVDDLDVEKIVISKRINSQDGYLLNESEREDLYNRIASLQLSIAVDEDNARNDERRLKEYNRELDMLQKYIERNKTSHNEIGNIVRSLEVKKAYFYKEYSQSQIDDINKEIKKNKKKMDEIAKKIYDYRQHKQAIESCITFIKKKMKSNNSLRGSKQTELADAKDSLFNGVTTRYSLGEDRQKLLYIDFMNKLLEFANYLLGQDYIKRLDELTLETIDPFVSVVGFHEYEHLDLIYSPEFISAARNAIIRKLDEEVMRPEVYIEWLNSQDINVSKFGAPPKTMEESPEISKTVRFVNE